VGKDGTLFLISEIMEKSAESSKTSDNLWKEKILLTKVFNPIKLEKWEAICPRKK
jgi:hypothetical protein